MHIFRNARLWAAVTAVFLIAGNDTFALSSKVSNSSADNKFAFQLFGKAVDANENLVMCPLSAFIVLGMTSNGAAGTTASAMAKALQLSDSDLPGLNKQNAETLAALSSTKSVLVANGLFADASTRLKQSFLDMSKKVYGANVRNVNFADGQSLKIINGWVSEHTAGKIPEIFRELSPQTRIILLNAVYFKGAWLHKFDKNVTTKKPFHLLGGSAAQVDMMTINDQLMYTKESNFQMVKVPYSGKRLSMYIMLPDSTVDFSTFCTGLHMSDFDVALQKLKSRQIAFGLPKFKAESERSLESALSKLGMSEAFDKKLANFSKLSEKKVWITKVVQKVLVEVNEEGTTAAAATAVVMGSKEMFGEAPPPFTLTIDRPFVFAIRDDEAKHIVFLGSVVHPL
jgi:serine protease inhibitor